MLKAKIKEKLLNRRDDVEISELTDSSGVSVDAEKLFNDLESLLSRITLYDDYIEVNQEVDLLGELWVDPSNIINFDDENPLFPLDNNGGKVIRINQSEKGFDSIYASQVFYPNEDPDNLSTWLLTNYEKLKEGDIIVSNPSGCCGFVSYMNVDNVTMTFLHRDHIEECDYVYSSGENIWNVTRKTTYAGTKLYKHEIKFSDNDGILIVSTRSQPYSDRNQFIGFYSGEILSGVFFYGSEDGYIGAILDLNDGGVTYYSDVADQIRNKQLNSSITISSDTVTAL